MAQVYVSPGVYARERDYSYYVRGISESSLALIGVTKKGPAFRPVLVSNLSEYESIFGKSDGNSLTPYYAKSYFKYGGSAYVVRVLGDEQVYPDSFNINHIYVSGGPFDSGFTVATLMATGTNTIALTANTEATDDHDMVVVGVYTGSVNFVNTNAANYIENIFPKGRIIDGSSTVCTAVFPNATTYWNDLGYTDIAATSEDGTASNSTYDFSGYSNARTPAITSDHNNQTTYELFTIYSISDGVASNTDIKISIEEIDQTNRTFDIVVRDFSDTNSNKTVYERFSKCNLDPSSTSYIEYQIGDSRDGTGDYPLNSNYIYVTVTSGVRSGAYKNRLPAGYKSTVCPGVKTTIVTHPDFPTITAMSSSVSSANQYYGVDFSNLDNDILGTIYNQYDVASLNGMVRRGFFMDSTFQDTDNYYTANTSFTAITKDDCKFLVPMIGGREGWTLAYEAGAGNSGRTAGIPSLFTDTSDSNLDSQYKAGIDAISNPEEYDVNLMAIPGVAISDSIGVYAISVCEARADCFYIGDMQSAVTTVSGAVNAVSSIDTNYAATYYPWVKIFDSNSNKYINIPPTPNVLEAIAYTDANAYPWYAPAGMNRGLLTDILKPLEKLSVSDRDTLQQGRVNPIASFPGQGYSIWGQRTLQSRDTALDRINVRRMLIYARKLIAGVTQYLVFEQNNETTWTTFRNLVNPILDNIKNNNGVEDFRVIMDETTNTPDVIDRNEMVGQIYLKPTKTSEVIILNFNIMPQGAVFEE